MQRLVAWGVRRYVGGPGKSWVYTSLAILGMRAVRSVVGRQEVIDVGTIKRGQRVEIEHLSITHKRQIAELKAEKKAAKRTAKAAKRATKEAKRTAKAAKRATKEAKRTAKAEKRSARVAERTAKAEDRSAKRAAMADKRMAKRSNDRAGMLEG